MSKKFQRISAYGLLLVKNELLLCRLSPRVMKSAGHWTLPGGGLDFGESPEDAVVREFKEETGLIVETGALVAVDNLSDEVNGNKYHSVRIIYETHLIGGDLKFEQEGSTDLCEWFTEANALNQTLVSLAQVGVKHAFS